MRQALTRAVAAFRIAALGYAAVLIAMDSGDYARPALGWVVLGLMVGWTAVTVVGYERVGPAPTLVVADVAVAIGAVLATLAVVTTTRIDVGAPTLPAAWAAAPVLMAAIAGGPWIGGLAGALVSGADIAVRGAITDHTFNGVVLLLLAGAVGGYVVKLSERAEDLIETAAAHDAAMAERDRLAREIHDSTLQVLALVARQGAEPGGFTAELAAQAAAQEIALRKLVTAPPQADRGGVVDVMALVSRLASERVSISGPSTSVWLTEAKAAAVVGALTEAVVNVERHAGSDARAWLLVEDEDTEIVLSLRDDGPGVTSEQLADAASARRLGVAQSIVGRVEGIGGRAAVSAGPDGGTEVEIRVPR